MLCNWKEGQNTPAYLPASPGDCRRDANDIAEVVTPCHGCCAICKLETRLAERWLVRDLHHHHDHDDHDHNQQQQCRHNSSVVAISTTSLTMPAALHRHQEQYQWAWSGLAFVSPVLGLFLTCLRLCVFVSPPHPPPPPPPTHPEMHSLVVSFPWLGLSPTCLPPNINSHHHHQHHHHHQSASESSSASSVSSSPHPQHHHGPWVVNIRV